MTVTAAMIKELRERTGIGMMECKKALEEANGDMEAAIEALRKKGLAKAAKKADREAFEGGIELEIDDGKAYIVSIACETDFLANSEKFKAMLKQMLQFLKEHGADSKAEAQSYIEANYSLEMGENLQVKDYAIVEGETLGAYVHSNAKLAALVVGDAAADEAVLKQIAMHVTAANPEYLSPEDISDDIVEKEKQIQLDIMKNDPNMGNKSDDVLLKIIEGKMGKFKSEISLLEQDFVIDPSKKIKDTLGNGKLVSFSRFSI